MKRIRNAQELRVAMAAAQPTAHPGAPAISRSCDCGLGACPGWESLRDGHWPTAHVVALGTLRDPDLVEPTFQEHHPNGTRYESPNAPVAVQYFPYNRCDLHRCTRCQRHLLRYTEFGGYYVDDRVRELSASLDVV